jgi:hypothetical protein
MDRLRKGIDLRVVMGAVLLATSGCVSSGGAADPFTGPAKSQIVIEVDNQGFNQATVWMISSAGERRLGTVNGKGEKSYTLQWPRSGDLRLRVRVVGKRGFTTARQLVFPGENVELRIT